MKLRLIVASLCICMLPVVASADTRTAVDCTRDAVNTAIGLAEAGDTVEIPACAEGVSWTSGIAWTAPANVTLKGAGTTATGGGDQTVIIDDSSGTTNNPPIFNITVANTGTFRMTGITIEGGSGNHENYGVVKFNGPGVIRLDHIHIDVSGYSSTWNGKSIYIGNNITGVMDDCILDNTSGKFIFTYNGSSDRGDTTWSEATGFGGSNFFFIEDNILNGNPAVSDSKLLDGYTSSRVVVRFNNIIAAAGADQHATGHSADDRGPRAFEYYGNYHEQGVGQGDNENYCMTSFKSGTGLIWGNSAVETFRYPYHFQISRMNNATYTQSAPPAGWGYCGADFDGTGSDWDENSVAGTGYACIDQPGRGQGQLLSGNFPNKVNSVTGTIAWPNQASEPIYIWGNDVSADPDASGSLILNVSNTASGYRITQNADNTMADYSATQTPSYYPQASGIQVSSSSPFDGTTGTGWGTLANRPATCTAGVAYWATDQGSWNTSTSNPYGVQQSGADGVLYKCTSTDTWTAYYTPYTYPHPLRGTGRTVSAGQGTTVSVGTGSTVTWGGN